MSTKNYLNAMKAKPKATPQSRAIPGREKEMVRNNAGGVVFSLNEFSQLDRFLILGSESPTYYASANTITLDNAKNVRKLIAQHGVRVVDRVVEISEAGRAPKNDPALLVMALCLTEGDEATRQHAALMVPRVARIGTDILHLTAFLERAGKWGRVQRRAVANWFNSKTAKQLAYQITKYNNRDGFTMLDTIRLAHPKPISPSHDALFAHLRGVAKEVEIDEDVANYMAAVDEIKTLADSPSKAAQLISEYGLPFEVLPTELLRHAKIWDALVPNMGMGALVRNLATMTRVGYIAPNSDGQRAVLAKLSNIEAVKKSRIHPIKVLAALMTYEAGQSVRGSNSWIPARAIVDGLDELFYLSFGNVDPSGMRMLLALDVSASMTWHNITGVPGLTPRIASAALSMVTANTEKEYEIVGFTSGPGGISRLKISPRQRLNDVISEIRRHPMGGTDCSLPMLWATKYKVPVDTFVVYTDAQTWAGTTHPTQALKEYRDKMGIQSRLVVVGMEPTSHTIADPKDVGQLDVVGFDMATPELISSFAKGEF